MNNQYELDENLRNCPVCNKADSISEFSLEVLDTNNEDLDVPEFSKYWIGFSCQECNVTWGYSSWTGDDNNNEAIEEDHSYSDIEEYD